MATTLHYDLCKIILADNLINCSYLGHYYTESWQIEMAEDSFSYKKGWRKPVRFDAKDVKEFQFEMLNGGGRYGDVPAVMAYVVRKSDDDPVRLFYFAVHQEYVLLNQTKAHEFCSAILKHIGEKYKIPFYYKLSVDTKEKQNLAAFIPILIFIMLFLLFLISGL